MDGKVVRGREGWLFLDSDSNEVVKQHSGELLLSLDDLRRWQSLLESRIERLADSGAEYLFAVAPDPHAVYPEMLPEGVEVAQTRPVLQLVEHLEREGSPARIMYPLEQLMAEKRANPVFPKTGTHWNGLGSFLAYDALASELERIGPLRRLTRDQVLIERTVMLNDLGQKVSPKQTSEALWARPRSVPQARLVSDNCVVNMGALITLICKAAPEGCCVMFGDSSSYGILQFLAEGFRRFVFAHTPAVDFDLVRREQPHVVISLMTERFLITVPTDSKDLSIQSLEREKLANETLRNPLKFIRAMHRKSAQPSAPGASPDARDIPRVEDVMMPALSDRIGNDITVREAAKRLVELEVFALRVVDADDRFLGVITARDVADVIAADGDPDSVRIGDVVTQELVVAAEDALDDAAAVMRHQRVGWLSVVDGKGRLVGRVTKARIDDYLKRVDSEHNESTEATEAAEASKAGEASVESKPEG